MRIGCPYCGERSNDEFTVLGDAAALLARPNEATLEAFDGYIYARPNPAGVHHELWHHHGGCRQWLVVERNTLTHAVHSVVLARSFDGRVV